MVRKGDKGMEDKSKSLMVAIAEIKKIAESWSFSAPEMKHYWQKRASDALNNIAYHFELMGAVKE